MKKKLLLFCMTMLAIVLVAKAEENEQSQLEKKNPVSVSLSGKIKSRHVWNGWLSCNSWNIQPDITVSAYGVFFDAWAYMGLGPDNPSEIDLTLGYTYGPFTAMYIDMFYPTENKKGALPRTKGTSGFMNYFRYNTQDGGDIHQQMAMLRFGGIKYFPLYLTAALFTFGDGNKNSEGVFEEKYSLLLDLGYSHTLKTGQTLSYNLSGTPYEGSGFFADGPNIVNVRFGVSQPVKITDSYSIHLEGELVMNPYRENLYLIFGIGF